MIYGAAFVTLIALIVAFVVLKNPNKNQIIIEFSSLFVAEWGIQLVGAAQASSALELVFLIRAITSTSMESVSRQKFYTLKKWNKILLTIFCVVIVAVPISFIIRSTIIFNKNDRHLISVAQDK